MARSTDKRRSSIGVLFWIAFILLILVIFLANRTRINDVLDSTGLLTVLRDRVDSDSTGDSPGEDPLQPPTEVEEQPQGQQEPIRETPAEEQSPPDPAPALEEGPATETDREEDSPGEEILVTERRPANERRATLYFIRLSEDGRVYPERVVRSVGYDSSPLTETIRTLLSGPTSGELSAGLLNLIPEGTELISARVEDGVAYLNFNDNFRFNPMGLDGMIAQLKQIIYSSTEFSTVSKVQFLVEGEVVQYLGGEGVFIGAPLGRESFG